VDLLVLSAADVHAALGYADCAQAMRDALTALAAGRAQQPLRTVVQPDGAAGLIALMPAYLAGDGSAGLARDGGAGLAGDGGAAAYGLKALCITPGNPVAGLDAHQGVVLLSDGRTGEPVAILNASAVTEIRTAAVSVIATELLARPDAATLAVIGAGVQARAHILALDHAWPLADIRVASRDGARATQLAASLHGRTTAPVRASPSARAAVTGADIVVTATSSATPVLRCDWLAPGTHINAVGACVPHARELDTATVAGAVLFADRRDSLLAESGDYLLAAADEAVGPASVRAELGEVLLGDAPGRLTPGEITVFESLGLAVEDLAAAALAYRNAVRARETGTPIGSLVRF
jgi:ornithine cyclodeaminase